MLDSRVCAVVVTYNPDAALQSRVQTLAAQVDLVIVVDNASSPETMEFVQVLGQIDNLELIENSSNLGLATAFNIGLKSGLAKGFKYLITFDQDSDCKQMKIQDLIQKYQQLENQQIGVLSPTYIDEDSNKTINPDPLHVVKTKPSHTCIEVDSTLSSGSLVSAAVLEKVGLLEEHFFIDYLDHDFCLRCKWHGYKIFQASDVFLAHRLGTVYVNWLGFQSIEHSPLRVYYQYRNRIALYRKYFRKFPAFIFRDVYYTVTLFLELIFFQSKKLERLQAVFKGIRDGLRFKDWMYRP